MRANCIVLLTDFGVSDPYVGIMKGVINQIRSDLQLIDLSHQILPGDIQEGAFQLWQAAGYFPPEAVFLAVVDPGVGTNRKGLFVQRGNQVFIGPDNGIFTYLGYKSAINAWELENPDYQLANVSNTFHGRDIFAPAAAFAAMGIQGEQFGDVARSLVHLPQPVCQIEKDRLKGEILSRDRFGNLITSLGQFHQKGEDLEIVSWVDDSCLIISSDPILSLEQPGMDLPLVSTFTDIPAGSCAGLIGSSGLLEIVANQRSAADQLGLDRGDQITLTWK